MLLYVASLTLLAVGLFEVVRTCVDA